MRAVLAEASWLAYVIQIGLLVLGAWILRTFVLRWLRRWAARTRSSLDDALVVLLDHALTPLLALSVLGASLNLVPLSDRMVALSNRILYLGLLAVALGYGAKGVLGYLRAALKVMRRWGFRGLGKILAAEWAFASPHLGYVVVVGHKIPRASRTA